MYFKLIEIISDRHLKMTRSINILKGNIYYITSACGSKSAGCTHLITQHFSRNTAQHWCIKRTTLPFSILTFSNALIKSNRLHLCMNLCFYYNMIVFLMCCRGSIIFARTPKTILLFRTIGLMGKKWIP